LFALLATLTALPTTQMFERRETLHSTPFKTSQRTARPAFVTITPARNPLNRVGDSSVTEAGLQCPRIVSLVCRRVAAGVPEHVRVCLEPKLGRSARTFNDPCEASGGGKAPDELSDVAAQTLV